MKKQMTKIINFLLCICLIFSMPLQVHATETEENGTIHEARLTITNRKEFLDFAEKCRLDSFSENLIVSLETDIDLAGIEFEGIPIFCGMFEGNHHAITGVDITDNGSTRGLFRYLTDTAVVQNLSVKGKVTPQGSRSAIGGLAGSNAGTVKNCSFSGEVAGKNNIGGLVGINEVTGTIDNCQVEGSVQGTHFVGGVAGENYGVIRDCTNLSSVNTAVQKNNIEVSDITMESLTGSEASYTVTDVGGIAGSSSGVIRSCDNKGTVGYQHVGYNIGGIAGSQVGYIYDCENQGQILGRKEEGGIVGQMEPVVNLEFSADTLQILEGQLSSASARVKQSADNIQSRVEENSNDVNSQIDKLQDELGNAGDAVTQLLKDIEVANKESDDSEKSEDAEDEDAEDKDASESEEEREWYERLSDWQGLSLPDEDSILAARNSLNNSMSTMKGTLKNITENGQSTIDTLSEEMQGIVNQARNITSTVANASDNIGISVTDVSDSDTDENTIAKIESCKNFGTVQADLNAGGILGAVALENDLDPEGELEISGEASLNLEGELRAVILNCENGAKVAVKRQNGGGIVGWLSMGLIRNCLNTGALDAETADYVGGIVGQSTGYIRNSSTKCELSGNTYVGGIAGSGTVVSECRSMVQINAGSERSGSILGFAAENYREEETPVYDNFYLSIYEDFGGIDGISYSGLAEPLERDRFLTLENLPEEFWKVNVTFVFEDNSMERIAVNHGGTLVPEDIPKVPEKEGYLGFWEGLEEADTEEILFDISFDAAYTPVKGTISSKNMGENGKPVLLVQGTITSSTEVELTETETKPPLQSGQTLINTWGFTLEENETAAGARYLIPSNVNAESLCVMVRSEEKDWHQVECTVDGSYIAFPLENGENQIAVIEEFTIPWLWIAVSAVVLVLIIGVIVWKKKGSKKEK